MAQNKKSVLLYCDLIHTVEKMDDETAGLFFKHYLRYVNDKHPETDNLIVDIAFESVKQNLKRDLKKWEKRAENSRNNGKKGGRPKEPKKPSGLIDNLTEPKEPVTDTVTVTVTDNVKVKLSISERKINFSKSLNPFMSEYGKPMLEDFIEYWCEYGAKDKKMRFEKQTSFSIKRRLKTWKNNSYGNKKTTQSNPTGAGTERQNFN